MKGAVGMVRFSLKMDEGGCRNGAFLSEDG
jgi:hypothetical protein